MDQQRLDKIMALERIKELEDQVRLLGNQVEELKGQLRRHMCYHQHSGGYSNDA